MTSEAVSTTSTPTLSADDPMPDDSYGWVMFVAFTLAVIGISFVVCVLALEGSWLMLGIAMVVHIGVTAAMMKVVLGAFGPETEAYPDIERIREASIARAAQSSPAPVVAAVTPLSSPSL